MQAENSPLKRPAKRSFLLFLPGGVFRPGLVYLKHEKLEVLLRPVPQIVNIGRRADKGVPGQ